VSDKGCLSVGDSDRFDMVIVHSRHMAQTYEVMSRYVDRKRSRSRSRGPLHVLAEQGVPFESAVYQLQRTPCVVL